MKPGDTLFVRAGTYVESLEDVVPGGTSWTSTVTIAAYPGEKPILQPASGANWVLHFQGDATKYIEVRGLVLDAKVARPDIAC